MKTLGDKKGRQIQVNIIRKIVMAEMHASAGKEVQDMTRDISNNES
jgi:hypothetical protein